MKSLVAEVRQEMTYSQHLAKAAELRAKSSGLLFDRLLHLVKVYEDREFLDTHKSLDDAIEYLESYVADTCCTFLELVSMMKMFPGRREWQETKLQELRAKHHIAQQERRKAAREESGEEPRQAKRITQKEFAEVQARAVRAEESERLQSSELTRLRQENADLRERLAKAEGRIEELERHMQRHKLAS